MAASFFFYDLETSGFNPREARIVQFAGRRTNLDLEPIGEPLNCLIRLTDDVLPDPDAVLVTGITPQQTLDDGYSEVEFLKLFYEQAVQPETIFVGFNSIRFDDEFMRFLHYRNFYDPYEWAYKDGNSRWDLLDVLRMTRALRPKGIKWPVDAEGKPTNRLELMTAVNKLDHEHAHDALSDVEATIAVAKLIKAKQPDLFNYLLKMRDKKLIAQLVLSGQPFVYTSGKYASEHEKTTIAITVAELPNNRGVLVYDLREDPTAFVEMTVQEIAEAWRRKRGEEGLRLPVKKLMFNHCPAIAPLGVIDAASQKRLGLDLKKINKHAGALANMKDWVRRVSEALDILDQQQQTSLLLHDRSADEQLYDGFYDNRDRQLLSEVRAVDPSELSAFVNKFKDLRLQAMLPLYKARNFPNKLEPEERLAWEKYKYEKLFKGGEQSRAVRFATRLSQLAAEPNLSSHEKYLLEDLRLYAESIVPSEPE